MTTTTTTPSFINGYWLIKNTTTGRSALIKAPAASPSSVPLLSADFYQQTGSQLGDTFKAYYMGGAAKNLDNEFLKAVAALQVNVDTIPAPDQFGAGGTITQKLNAGGIVPLNFDLLNPVGTNPNTYQQGTAAAGGAVQGAVNAAKNAVGGIGNLGALLGSMELWKGIGLVIAGVLILLIAGREIVKL